MRRISAWIVAGALSGTTALLGLACGNQAEGQICNLLAQDTDCNAGLACIPPGQLSGIVASADTNIGRCCPADRTAAKADVCKQPINPGVSTTLPDASPDTSTPLPTPEAGPDTSIADANVDGG